jgi:hypothetical protein
LQRYRRGNSRISHEIAQPQPSRIFSRPDNNAFSGVASQRSKAGILFNVVRPIRFERTASTSGVLRSIQLSYGRPNSIYSKPITLSTRFARDRRALLYKAFASLANHGAAFARQPNGEGRPITRLAGHDNISPVALYDPVAHRKAQAHAHTFR